MLTEADAPLIALPEDFIDHRNELIRQGVLPTTAGDAFFAWYCCQNIRPLPQKKIDGLPLHLPGVNLGTWQLGWQSATSVVYVAPQPPPMTSVLPMASDTGALVVEEMGKAGLVLDSIYATYAVRFALTEGRKSYLESHKRSCAALARADVLGLRPRAVIASGSDALKAFFGRDAKVDNYLGVFHDWHGIPIMTTESHLSFASGHASLGLFASCLDRVRDYLAVGKVSVTVPSMQDYRICRTANEIVRTCDELVGMADTGVLDLVVVDTEFGNDVAREEETYTISVQVAWGDGCAAYFGLYGQDGVAFMSEPDLDRSIQSMKRLFEHPGIRLGGHHLRVDIQRLSELGIEVDEKIATGYDTMLLHHLLFGDDDQGLEVLVRKACPEFGNFWKPLEDWLDANSRNVQLQFGYSKIPDDILIPYSIRDADATFRALHWLLKEFRKPANQHLLELYFNITAPTSLHLLDVERQGILIDDTLRAEIRAFYTPVYEDLLARLRKRLNWPGFNPGSKDQVLMLLFNERNYYDKKPGIVPEGAKVMKGLMPLFNTDKYPRDWGEIVAEGKEHLHTPSTKSEALEILYNDTKIEEIKLLRQLSILGKFLRDYLHPIELNDFGYVADGKGLHNNIWKDGRVRTHLWQTSETHRYRSSKPNLQTSPKKQEAAAYEVFIDYYFGLSVEQYKEMCRDDVPASYATWIPPELRVEVPSYKACMVAPEDHYLIEADFATAELAVLAYASGDPILIAIVDQGRDLHSEMACIAFKLPLRTEMDDAIAFIEANKGKPAPEGWVAPKGFEKSSYEMVPYEKWAKKFKKTYGHLRIAAKTVNFGIMYGRGARALAREIAKAGVTITVEETQAIIDNFAKTFAKGWAWMQANMDSAIERGFVEDCAGRRRYFTGVHRLSKSQQAAARRQASNSPIQGTVAYLLSLAGVLLYRYRYHTPVGRQCGFKILLPIHDAFLIEVHKDFLKPTLEIVKLAMGKLCTIPGTGRHLGVDIEVFKAWGQKIPLSKIPELAEAA
jgi:DNA polymerase I-like protein with 3'-5' exonuclease and polymerase domains